LNFKGLQGIWWCHFSWQTVPCSCHGDGERSVAESGQSCRWDIQCRGRRDPSVLDNATLVPRSIYPQWDCKWVSINQSINIVWWRWVYRRYQQLTAKVSWLVQGLMVATFNKLGELSQSLR